MCPGYTQTDRQMDAIKCIISLASQGGHQLICLEHLLKHFHTKATMDIKVILPWHQTKCVVHILGEICLRSDPNIAHMWHYLAPLNLKDNYQSTVTKLHTTGVPTSSMWFWHKICKRQDIFFWTKMQEKGQARVCFWAESVLLDAIFQQFCS